MRNAFRYRILFALLVFIVLTALYSACTEKAKNTVIDEVSVNAPTQLQATRNPQGDVVFLQWLDNADNESGFVIERSTSSASNGFQTIESINSQNIVVYSDSTVPRDTICFFRVIAVSDDVNSLFSNVVAVNINQVNAPDSLTAVRDIATGHVDLSWRDNSINETHFFLERSTYPLSNNFHVLRVIQPNITEYRDTTAPLSVTSVYRVYALSGPFHSAYSYVQIAAAITLQAPENVTATRIAPTTVQLAWQNLADSASGYLIERSTVSAESGFQALTTTGADVETYTDNTAPIDRVCYYRICSFLHSTHSEFSATAAAPLFTITAPSELTASRVGAHIIRLHWEDVNFFETGFIVERTTTSNTTGFRTITTLSSSNVVTYSDNNAPVDSNYHYRVYAVSQTLRSTYSNVATVPGIFVSAPQNLVATRRNETTVDLHWIDASNNETAFTVERATNNLENQFQTVGTLSPNINEFSDPNANIDNAFYYRVFATSGFAQSNYSNMYFIDRNNRPSAVELINPPNGETNVPVGVNLQWMATDRESDTIWYDVHLLRGNSPYGDSVIATRTTNCSLLTGRLATSTYYRWGVVAYDSHHSIPVFNAANSNSFTTCDNATSLLEWNDIPHTGQITLSGIQSLYSCSRSAIGGSGHHDTTYADTLVLDYEVFMLPNSSGGELNMNGVQLAQFPLIATGDSVYVETPTTLSSYFSHSLLQGVPYRNRQLFAQNVTIGSSVLPCVVVQFSYNSSFYRYGWSIWQCSLQLFFSPGIGLVKVYVYQYTDNGQLSHDENDSRSAVYTIAAP